MKTNQSRIIDNVLTITLDNRSIRSNIKTNNIKLVLLNANLQCVVSSAEVLLKSRVIL